MSSRCRTKSSGGFEGELREARDRYLDLYELAPVGYLDLDPSGIIIESNLTAAWLLRVERNALLGAKLSHFTERASETTLSQHLASTLSGPGKQISRVSMRRGDGVILAVRLESLKAESQGQTVCRTALVDVTDLERKEARMRRLAAVVNDSDDAIFVVGVSGEILSWNRGARAMYGGTESDMARLTLFDLAPESERTETAELLARLVRGERIQATPAERVARSGKRLSVLVTATALRSDDGRVVAASFTERDVSRQRKAQRDLEQREATLSAVVGGAADAIITCDESGVIEGFNPSAERMFGCTAEEALAIRFPELVPGAAELVLGADRELPPGPHELIARRKDGSEFPAHLSLTRVAVADRSLSCAFLRDVSQEKQLRDQLWTSQKIEAMGSLASGIAHDFNNTLQVVAGFAGLALTRLERSHPARAQVEKCHRAALRGIQLTRQLLSLGRPESAIQAVPIDAVVTSGCELARRLLPGAIVLDVSARSPDAAVLVGQGHIEQALLNLVINARDAMPHGGTITVATEEVTLDDEQARAAGLEAPGGYVRITVRDTGIGMDETTRRRIFEPFFTTKERGRGTGLGLSMVYGMARQAGGSVEVESQPGQGTTFVCHLPRTDLRAARSASEPVHATRHPAKVLVVDDELTVRALIEQYLERLGHRVVSAASPSEALAVVERDSEPADLLLVNVMMPGRSGRELAEDIAQRWPDIRTLFISAYPGPQLFAEAWLEPGSWVLSKPFDQAELGRTIDEILAATPVTSAKPRVMVAEDSNAAREALSQLLAEAGYEVVSARNSDEALALVNDEGKDIDILVTDMKLSGGGGDDLVHQLEQRLPDLRSVLMSGGAAPALGPNQRFVQKPFSIEQMLAALTELVARP